MINVSEVVKVIKTKNLEVINALIQDRSKVSLKMMDFIYRQGIEGIEITKDGKGRSASYYIWYKDNVKGKHEWARVNLGWRCGC